MKTRVEDLGWLHLHDVRILLDHEAASHLLGILEDDRGCPECALAVRDLVLALRDRTLQR